MLKDVLKEKNIKTAYLAKCINEPYMTVNDLVNGRVNIEECKVKLLKEIAEFLGITMEDAFKLCDVNKEIYSEKYDLKAKIVVTRKKYYVTFVYENVSYQIELGKVTEITSMFIMDVALHEMEELISQKEMEKYLCSMLKK